MKAETENSRKKVHLQCYDSLLQGQCWTMEHLSMKLILTQYGTSSNMKGAKYAAVNNSAIRSYTRKDVKSGATYYVRVRTFNVVNGKRIYSDWSGIKRMRVK